MREYNIKPKPTVYDGIKFRSRLEARWAVFFNTLGIKYEYEKKYFQVNSETWYMPDFWIDTGWIVEVKPTPPTVGEKIKAMSVTGKIAIVSGLPNTTCQSWLYGYGQAFPVKLSKSERVNCFIKKMNADEWLNLKKLYAITEKFDFIDAFIQAERYKFNEQ